MKKQVKEFPVEFNFSNWIYGVDIKTLRDDLDKLEALGANWIYIEGEDNYGSCSVSISASVYREETDEECKYRIESEKRFEEENIKRDLDKLRTLISKYGKDV